MQKLACFSLAVQEIAFAAPNYTISGTRRKKVAQMGLNGYIGTSMENLTATGRISSGNLRGSNDIY